MATGMLWYDDSADTIEVKLRRGAAHFEKKHGVKPGMARVGVKRESGESGSSTDVDDIRVDFTHKVSVGHIVFYRPIENAAPVRSDADPSSLSGSPFSASDQRSEPHGITSVCSCRPSARA
jgi:hypothetical protein